MTPMVVEPAGNESAKSSRVEAGAGAGRSDRRKMNVWGRTGAVREDASPRAAAVKTTSAGQVAQ